MVRRATPPGWRLFPHHANRQDQASRAITRLWVPEQDEAGVGAAQYGHCPGRPAVRTGKQAQRYRQRHDISARRHGLDARRLTAMP
jgi:hypothetical protein